MRSQLEALRCRIVEGDLLLRERAIVIHHRSHAPERLMACRQRSSIRSVPGKVEDTAAGCLVTHVIGVRVFTADLQRLAGAQLSVAVEQVPRSVTGASTIDKPTDPAGADRECKVDEVTSGELCRVGPFGISRSTTAHHEHLRDSQFNHQKATN